MNSFNEAKYRRNMAGEFVALLALMVVLNSKASAQTREKISYDSAPKIHELRLEELQENDAGWEIILKIDDPRAADLDLEVYSDDPKGKFIDPICVSEGAESIERCRVNKNALPENRAWIKVYPVDGTGSTLYTSTSKRLEGPSIENTDLYGSDVATDPLFLDSKTKNVFGYDLPDSRHLYRIKPPDNVMQKLSVRVKAKDGKTHLQLAIYDYHGELVSSAAKHASEQIVTIDPEKSKEFYALVELETLRSIAGKQVEYEIEVRRVEEGFDLDIALAQAEEIKLDEPQYIYQPRNFRLRLTEGNFSFIVLRGDGFKLSVYPAQEDIYSESREPKEYHGKLLDRSTQFVTLGDSLKGSPYILTRLRTERTYLIRVTQLVASYIKNATLYVQDHRGAFAIRFSPAEAKKLKFKTVQPQIEDGSTENFFVYELTETNVEFLQATLDESNGLSKGFDLAFCNQYGDVLDINENEVTFTGFTSKLSYPGVKEKPYYGLSKGDERLFLVIFHRPTDTENAGSKFRVLIKNKMLMQGRK